MILPRVYPRHIPYDAYQITAEWLDGPGPRRLGLEVWVHYAGPVDRVHLVPRGTDTKIEAGNGDWLLVDTEGTPVVYSDAEFRKRFEEVLF